MSISSVLTVKSPISQSNGITAFSSDDLEAVISTVDQLESTEGVSNKQTHVKVSFNYKGDKVEFLVNKIGNQYFAKPDGDTINNKAVAAHFCEELTTRSNEHYYDVRNKNSFLRDNYLTTSSEFGLTSLPLSGFHTSLGLNDSVECDGVRHGFSVNSVYSSDSFQDENALPYGVDHQIFDISEINEIKEIKEFKPQGEGCVFAFDLDDVIIQTDLDKYDGTGTPPQKYVDSNFPKKFQELKNQYPKAHFVVITRTPELQIQEKLEMMKKELGYEDTWFSKHLVSGSDKGQCLDDYFKANQIKYTHIVMIDDHTGNLEKVSEYQFDEDVKVTTVQFMASIENLMLYHCKVAGHDDIRQLLGIGRNAENCREQYGQLVDARKRLENTVVSKTTEVSAIKPQPKAFHYCPILNITQTLPYIKGEAPLVIIDIDKTLLYQVGFGKSIKYDLLEGQSLDDIKRFVEKVRQNHPQARVMLLTNAIKKFTDIKCNAVGLDTKHFDIVISASEGRRIQKGDKVTTYFKETNFSECDGVYVIDDESERLAEIEHSVVAGEQLSCHSFQHVGDVQRYVNSMKENFSEHDTMDQVAEDSGLKEDYRKYLAAVEAIKSGVSLSDETQK